ncbi:hypothetical protein AYL99_11882 [Fonsecaea erecta]|uniref:Uncharacterized protein n=1 Tax=Fonsecaea erecta TaxID=1367422 RepID=A0A178Z256_9EURO|nr:hypothetical protein AYL99_11882 [Fonsecaea erecta]OAP53860.1 hypothetical protein AYL99_11882 [Fonsecaea erecta]
MCITRHSYKFWYGIMHTGSIKILFCGDCVIEAELTDTHDLADVCDDVPRVMGFYRNLVSMGDDEPGLEEDETRITPCAWRDSLIDVGMKKTRSKRDQPADRVPVQQMCLTLMSMGITTNTGRMWHRYEVEFISSYTIKHMVEHTNENVIVCMVVVKIRQTSSGELTFTLLEAIESLY